MADFVKVEYRGIFGELAVGEHVVVRAVGAGVLHLEREVAAAVVAPGKPTETAPAPKVNKEGDVNADA